MTLEEDMLEVANFSDALLGVIEDGQGIEAMGAVELAGTAEVVLSDFVELPQFITRDILFREDEGGAAGESGFHLNEDQDVLVFCDDIEFAESSTGRITEIRCENPVAFLLQVAAAERFALLTQGR